MKRRLILSVLIGAILLLQYPLWLGNGSVGALWRLHQEVEMQKQENARLNERNQALAAEVMDLKQGLAAVEERARWELGMVKISESFYQIVSNHAPSESVR